MLSDRASGFTPEQLQEAAWHGNTGLLDKALKRAEQGYNFYDAMLKAGTSKGWSSNDNQWSANDVGYDKTDGYLSVNWKVSRLEYQRWKDLLGDLKGQLKTAYENSAALNEAAQAYKNDEAAVTFSEMNNSQYEDSGRLSAE